VKTWTVIYDLKDSVFCSGQRAFYANRRKLKSTRFPIRKEWRPLMPLGAKEPNRNYTVYGKFKSPSSLLYWSRKQRLYLAINKIAGLFFTYSAHPLTIKKYGGFDMTNMFKICQLFLFTLSLVILFSVTIVIAQEGLLDGKVFVGQSKEKHKKSC